MHTNAYVSTLDSDAYSDLKCVSSQLEVRENDDYKMQNSSPMSDRAGVSILYNDSGYHTNVHPDPTSFSSNSNSEPSFETSEEMSLHSRPVQLTSSEGSNNLFFCEDAVFDEPKLVGPPLLCDNTNNYEEFSSLIKFSLEDTASNYLNNDINLHSAAPPILRDYTMKQEDTASSISNITNKDNSKLLPQFEDNLCSLTSVHIRQGVQENVLLIEPESSNSSIINFQNTSSSIFCNSSKIVDKTSLPVEANFINSEISAQIQSQQTTSSSIYSDYSNIVNNTSFPVEVNFINSEVSAQILCNNITNSTINDDDIVNDNDNLSSQMCHTPSNSYKNNMTSDMSPELFSEAEDEPPIEVTSSFSGENMSHNSTLGQICSQVSPEYENTLRNDRILLKRVQETLSGVPPPPSVTILQMSASEMLEKINSNKQFFFDQLDQTSVEKNTNEENSSARSIKSLLVNTNIEKALRTDWKEILQHRYHGLHYNHGKTSEDFEQYCAKYGERYIGAETASSCTAWSCSASGSSMQRRTAKQRWGVKSPGRRLSHLARRRITFSSSNLQQGSSSFSVMGNSSSSRQLMIDARRSALQKRRSPRKSPRKTPGKRSPRKSPQKRVRTPNSSAKKPSSARRLNMNFDDDPKPGCSKVSSTKRALFQSPDHSRSTVSSNSPHALQRNKSKRALFTSPTKKSPGKVDRKRKRPEEEYPPNKIARSYSFESQYTNGSTSSSGGSSLHRCNSEILNRPESVKKELSDLHKKKIVWAVSEALGTYDIGIKHPKFKTFGSSLCKIVKHQMPELLAKGPRQPGSTSDRMFHLAKQHSFAVIRGKSTEDIIKQIVEDAKLKPARPPKGYVALEDSESRSSASTSVDTSSGSILAPARNILQDRIMNIESNSNSSLSRSGSISRNSNHSRSSSLRSPDSVRDTRFDENSKYRSIKRQIIFDDAEISKTHNTNR